MTNPSEFATHKNKTADYSRAQRLRKDPTDGEQILWYQLRIATKNSNVRFRRQYPIHPYIADFVCLKLRLIVEVDGVSHDTRQDEDARRDAHLHEMGFEVLRYTNEDVVTNRDGVVSDILQRTNEILAGNPRPRP